MGFVLDGFIGNSKIGLKLLFYEQTVLHLVNEKQSGILFSLSVIAFTALS